MKSPQQVLFLWFRHVVEHFKSSESQNDELGLTIDSF